MRLMTVLVVLTGVVLAPVWGAPPAEACQHCACQSEGTGQLSQLIHALTGLGSPLRAPEAEIKSGGPWPTAGKLAQVVTRRLGAGGVLGLSAPIDWR